MLSHAVTLALPCSVDVCSERVKLTTLQMLDENERQNNTLIIGLTFRSPHLIKSVYKGEREMNVVLKAPD